MHILYKYVRPEIALKCIPEVGDGTLRATQPAALNDPLECAVRTPYVFRDKQEENRKLAEVLTEINDTNLVTEDEVLQARNEHGSLFTRQLLTEQLSTKYGFVSFATDPRHPLMWSHYTTDGSGLAIAYDLAELKKLAETEEHLRKVVYGDIPPPIRDPVVIIYPESNLLKLLSVKSRHWSYENEWRLIVELSKTIGTGEKDRHGQPINLVRVPNEAVVGVYHTERTPKDLVDLVGDRLSDRNNRYSTESPHKLILSPDSYGYVVAPDNSLSDNK